MHIKRTLKKLCEVGDIGPSEPTLTKFQPSQYIYIYINKQHAYTKNTNTNSITRNFWSTIPELPLKTLFLLVSLCKSFPI